MELNLPNDINNTQWDCCVLGNGVAALWVAHWLWSSKKSVLWISSEEPYTSERALLQHGWLWDVSAGNSALLTGQLAGFESASPPSSFEAIYYDAKSTRRFKRLNEAKVEWGTHEKEYFQALTKSFDAQSSEASALGAGSTGFHDLWAWHSKLHAFHDTGQVQGPTRVELFTEPRFVRVQGWPLIELKTMGNRITGVVLAGLRPDETTEICAGKFYLGDYDENLPGLIKEPVDSEALTGALKGKSYRAGFGLRLLHKELGTVPTQTAVVPLIVSPEKDAGSHVVGRFQTTAAGLESLWVGFLTDEELEDNNEILKKIKQAKRALDRAIPGFADSILREAVTFEPRMRALDLVKNRKSVALGAVLFSDHYGPQTTAETVKKIFSGVVDGEPQSTKVLKKPRVLKAQAPAAECVPESI